MAGISITRAREVITKERIIQVPISVEKIIEVPIEKIVTVPVEKIVEKIVEVPVDRITNTVQKEIVEVPVSVAYYVPKIEIILSEEMKKTKNSFFGFTDLDDLYARILMRLLCLGREK